MYWPQGDTFSEVLLRLCCAWSHYGDIGAPPTSHVWDNHFQSLVRTRPNQYLGEVHDGETPIYKYKIPLRLTGDAEA